MEALIPLEIQSRRSSPCVRLLDLRVPERRPLSLAPSRRSVIGKEQPLLSAPSHVNPEVRSKHAHIQTNNNLRKLQLFFRCSGVVDDKIVHYELQSKILV